MTPRIAGVIVAAGSSTRMGEPKQLLTIGGRPMLQWVVDAAEASKLNEVVVVVGPAGEGIQDEIQLKRASWALNPDPARGTMSSLRAGVAAAEPADAVMKLVGDQPEVTAAIIDTLIVSWATRPHRASVVRYRDGIGHPILVSMSALSAMLTREGDRLLWQLIERDDDTVDRLEIDRLRPIDVNTPADARAAAARLMPS